MLDTASDETIGGETIGKVAEIVSGLAAQHEIRRRFAVTDSLVDGGFTSLAMVELMLAIEAELDMTIPQVEMKPTNFQSISTIAQMLQRLRAATV